MSQAERSLGLLMILAAAVLYFPRARVNAAFNANSLHSNAIKNLPPGGAVAAAGYPDSIAPGDFGLRDSGSNKYPAVDALQPSACGGDEDCKADEFCSVSGHGSGLHGSPVCLACRKRRKRCLRDAMCCPGNHCNNGMCMPIEHGHFHPGDIEETMLENFDHGTLDSHLKRTTSSSHYLKGQEGAICLRSSDCALGLCCARHFWSKICKPVLQEGQVCTKHRKKGSHGLEIFQRCYCADGLTCRLQKDHSNASRLHTCQRH